MEYGSKGLCRGGLTEVAVLVFPFFGHIKIDIDVGANGCTSFVGVLGNQYENQENAAADNE
jgi:hypothetical protein